MSEPLWTARPATAVRAANSGAPDHGTKRRLGWVYPLGFGVVVVLLWYVVVTAFHVPTYLVPSPVPVVRDIADNWRSMAGHLGTTVGEAALGFAFAVAAGGILGAMFATFRRLEQMVLPWAIASQAVPIVAIAPLLIMWFGNGWRSKVIMAALICFFPMLVNTTRGLRAADPQLLDLLRVYAASRWTVFWKVRMPSAMAYITAGMRVSAALAMIGAIVAELAGADKGIGFVLMQATYRFDAVRLFAAVILSAISGISFFGLVLLFERLTVKGCSQNEQT